MKAGLSSTRNSPNQQQGWVGPGRVLSYMFEFALIHVAAKGLLKEGAASMTVFPRRITEVFL